MGWVEYKVDVNNKYWDARTNKNVNDTSNFLIKKEDDEGLPEVKYKSNVLRLRAWKQTLVVVIVRDIKKKNVML